MIIEGDENEKTITLDANDIESAIRHFICACHPELAIGFAIDPEKANGTTTVPHLYKAKKG